MKLKGLNLFINNLKMVGIKAVSTAAIIMIALTGCNDNNGTEPPVNTPPDLPSEPFPGNGVTVQDIYIDLQWQCIDPENDALIYDLYFGTTASPPLIDSNLVNYIYPLYRESGPLDFGTTYYWKVDATDSEGHEVESDVWSFTTSKLYLVTTHTFSNNRNANNIFVTEDSLICVAVDNLGLYVIQLKDTIDIRNGIDTLEVVTSEFLYKHDVTFFVNDLCIIGDYAYLAYQKGLDIIDIVNLPDTSSSDLTLVGTYSTPYDTSEIGVVAVDVDGIYAYIVVRDSLMIVDVSDPANPSLAGSFIAPGRTYDVSVSGDYAYIANGAYGLLIVDVSDPASIDSAGCFDTPDTARAVFISGNYAYIADGNSGLIIVDISNPANPSEVGSYDTPGFAKDVYINGNYAYIADYWNGGFQILDITSPASPTLVVGFNSQGGAAGVFANENYVFLADRWKGVSVFEFEP